MTTKEQEQINEIKDRISVGVSRYEELIKRFIKYDKYYDKEKKNDNF